jgi:hypothetical protein
MRIIAHLDFFSKVSKGKGVVYDKWVEYKSRMLRIVLLGKQHTWRHVGIRVADELGRARCDRTWTMLNEPCA